MINNRFILPDLNSERGIVGTIIDVGPGKWDPSGQNRIPISFKVGDKVLLPQIGLTPITWDGVEYLAVSESSVLALIEE